MVSAGGRHLLEMCAPMEGSPAEGWLFSGQPPVNPLTTRQLKTVLAMPRLAGREIGQRVSLHPLRTASPPISLSRRRHPCDPGVLLGHYELDTNGSSTPGRHQDIREVRARSSTSS